MTDTRTAHGYSCYCDTCCDTATDWFEWRSASGNPTDISSRYWLMCDAIADKGLALSEGLTRLFYYAPGHQVEINA